jgi:DNA-binding NarL/FixJ family response regulator
VTHVDAPARPVSVLTVDDQAPFREVARALVQATPGFSSAGEAASGEEGLTIARNVRPDLVLVDVSMPGLDGFETTRRLHETDPGIVVVLVSADDDPVLQADAADSGAAGFIRKQDLRPAVLRAVWDACLRTGPDHIDGRP